MGDPTVDNLTRVPMSSGTSALSGPIADVIQTPSADIAAPAISAPSTPISQDPTLTAINNQPVAAPTLAQPGIWQRILTGALVGLAGSSGAKSFGAGAAGGAGASIAYQQQQRENKIQDQAVAQRKVAQQSAIRFQDAQSANLAAEAAMKDAQLHALPEQLRQSAIASSVSIMKELDSLGLRPVLEFPNTSEGAAGAASQLTNSHNGVPPVFTLNLGDKVVGYDLSQLSAAPQGLSIINQVNAIQGKPAIDQNMWNKMPTASRTQLMNNAMNFWDPVPSKENVNILAQQYQNNLDSYKKDPNADPALIQRLESTVSNLQKISKGLDVHDTNQKAADAGAEESARLRAKTANDNALLNKGGGATGEDYLKTLPAPRAAMIRSIAEGRMELTARMLQTDKGQAMAADLAQAYPGFDASRAPAYFAARKNFTSGKASVGINSLNTALGHLGKLYDVTTASATLPIVSGIARSFGGDHAKAFEYYKGKVGEEIQKAYVAGALTDRDKESADKQLSEWTPGNVRQGERALTTLLVSKLEAFQTQWETAKPSPAIADFPVISQANVANIKRITNESVPNITPSQSRQTLPGTEPTAVAPPKKKDSFAQFGGKAD